MALSTDPGKPTLPWPMVELVCGLLLLGIWWTLQFVVMPHTGFIHILLAAGVLLVIRGIARQNP